MSSRNDPEDPSTVRGWIRSWQLGKAMEAGYSDQEAINRDHEKALGAEKAEAEAFWAQMRAGGAPVAAPEPEPGPEPGADAGPDPEAGDEPGPEPEPEAQ
jgi:hypothetical protein